MDKQVNRAKATLAGKASRAPVARRRRSRTKSHDSTAAQDPGLAQPARAVHPTKRCSATSPDPLEVALLQASSSEPALVAALEAYRKMATGSRSALSDLYLGLRSKLSVSPPPGIRGSEWRVVRSMKEFRAAKRAWTEREARAVQLELQSAHLGVRFLAKWVGDARKVQWFAKDNTDISQWLALLVVLSSGGVTA